MDASRDMHDLRMFLHFHFIFKFAIWQQMLTVKSSTNIAKYRHIGRVTAVITISFD